MKFPKVNIVILNFNGLSDTIKCLKSVLKTKYPNFKILVADNGSKINEIKLLKQVIHDKKITFLRFSKNYGFSGGNNRIVKKLKSKYVVLLNNDTEVTPGWLNPLVKTLEIDKKIAVVQPKILWLENKRYFDYAGACGGYLDKFGYPFTRGRLFDTIEKDENQYNKPQDILWASGAAIIIRKKIIDKIGLFDEIFFNYMEEIDFCFRVIRNGFKIVSQPKSVVYHKVAGSARKKIFKKRFWEHRNNLLMILKNYPSKDLLLIFPQRLLLEYLSFFYYLLSGRLFFAMAVLASQASVLTAAYSIIKKRKFNNINTNAYFKKYIYPNSVVFDYFILGKKKYSQLKIR